MVRSAQLAEQWTLFEGREYQGAFEQTLAMLERLQGSDLRDAQRLMGLCCYHQREYSQASLWLRKACEGCDESGDWFHLAVSATLQGDDELGAEAFEQARICQRVAKYGQSPPVFLQVYGYATALCDWMSSGGSGQWARVQSLLDELAGAYRRLRNTDTAFLFRHGMPFLSSTLELATRCFRQQRQPAQAVAWLQALVRGLDEDGQRQVNRAIQDLHKTNGKG